jgi:ABC-type glycerol-3-phosphate transport system substrate-binding protein
MKKFVLFISLILMLLAMTLPASAEEVVTISLTVSQFSEDVFSEQIISQFEAQNPGVEVCIVPVNGFGASLSSEDDVEEYLDSVEEYVSSADVVLVTSASLHSEATRAG